MPGYLLHTHKNGSRVTIAGYIGVIETEKGATYFDGVGWSQHIDAAKIFVTKGGCRQSMNYWQSADHNPSPLREDFYGLSKVIPVKLSMVKEITNEHIKA